MTLIIVVRVALSLTLDYTLPICSAPCLLSLLPDYCVDNLQMPPYDDWNKVDDEEDDELQDGSVRPILRPVQPITLTWSGYSG